MKKRSILLTSAILLLCLALLCACQKKSTMVVGELSDLNVRDDLGITMTVDAKTLTHESALFLLSAETAIPYSYGDDYCLEVLQDDGWHSTDAILSYLFMKGDPSTGTPAELTADWSSDCGKLPKGAYRLLADVHSVRSADGESFYVACEFTIK